jgi:hypothetical protein
MLHVALVHYPVINKNGNVVTAAVTNLDLHDMARVCKTYGVQSFSVVTPLCDQKRLVKRIVSHWVDGPGGHRNPARRKALNLIRVEDSLDEAVRRIQSDHAEAVNLVFTSAKPQPGNIRFDRLREMLEKGLPHVLIFGTAWGLAPELMPEASSILEPVCGRSDYNHLSVRAAAAIILDRLLGGRG